MKMDRMTREGYENYWTKYPYHFEETHSVPATRKNIQEAYGSMMQHGIKRMVQEWAGGVRDLAETRDTMESPTYSIGTQN